MSRSGPVLLAGGGTGGHVFPLIALADAIAQLAPDVPLRFVGTEKGLEARVVRERGWELETLDVEPLKGRSILAGVRGGMIAGAAVVKAIALVARVKPRLCVSIGGYAAGPIGLACATLNVPLVLLEPNRVAGVTQRLLAPLAKRIYVAFPEAITNKKGRALGIPLRRGFSPSPSRRNGGPLNVLITGGSQGAEWINQNLPLAMAKVQGELRVVHQAGRGRADEVRARYGERRDVEVIEFIDDVPSRLSAAHVVVARAGALTLAEICAIGRPSILIPYPFAADDHQAANAQALAEAGAAIAMRQSEWSVDKLAEAISSLANDEPRRARMADVARGRGVPDAADAIARDLIDFIHPAEKSAASQRGAA